MRFSLQRNDRLDVLHLEIVARGVVFRCKLLHHRTLTERHVVLICRKNLVGILLRGLLDHLEERTLLLLAVDDEGAAENLVAAMLGVDLCKAEHFRVSQLSAQLTFHLVQVLNLFGRESKTLLFVIFLQILDVQDRCRLDVHREDVLIQALVHALQHGVVLSILAIYREIFLNALHTLDSHVLCDFHSVGAPRRNHLTAWTYKKTFQIVFAFGLSFAIQPAKFLCLISRQFVVCLRGNHTLCWSSEKVNHKVMCLKIWVQRYDFFPEPSPQNGTNLHYL